MSIRKAAIIRILFSLLILAIFTVSSLSVVYLAADYQKRNYFKMRKAQVSAAAAAIDPEDVMALKGDKSDIGTSSYESVVQELVRIKNSDPMLGFVYVMRPKGLQFVFLADAESSSSPEYSPPGELIQSEIYQELNVFEQYEPPVGVFEGSIHDKWGEWVSALALIVDDNGKPLAVLCTDVEAGQALAPMNNTRRYGITLVFGMAAVLALVLSQWMLWRYQRQKEYALRGQVRDSIDQQNEELVKANRMKLEFIQLSSHELRSPMNALAIAINAIAGELKGKLTEDQEKLVQIAIRGCSRLVDLVDNLLDITRLEAGNFLLRPAKVDLRMLVENTILIHEPQIIGKGLSIWAEIPEGDIFAVIDGQAMIRVLENLMSNAIKFTDQGEINVTLEVDDDNIRTTFKDTGIGIPEDFEGDIFDKFQTVEQGRDQRMGAGLGLAFTRSLIENQGGRIWYESSLGKGSLFGFEIPRYQSEVT